MEYVRVSRKNSLGDIVVVRNPSVILSPTLVKNEKVEHYIRIKTHKPLLP